MGGTGEFNEYMSIFILIAFVFFHVVQNYLGGGWEGLQSIGDGCGIKLDQFSSHIEPSEFFLMICMILVIMVSFSLVWSCFRKVSGPSESGLKVPGPHASVLSDWSQLDGTSRN